jgi:hypothetical protein
MGFLLYIDAGFFRCDNERSACCLDRLLALQCIEASLECGVELPAPLAWPMLQEELHGLVYRTDIPQAAAKFGHDCHIVKWKSLHVQKR